MADLSFMKQKYSVDSLITHYLEEIKKLRAVVNNPQDETKLQIYYQAANSLKNITVKDLAQFALSYGAGSAGKSAQLRSAFPILIGNRITQPSKIDLAYLQLMVAYAKAFRVTKGNLKDWLLKFVIASRFSPVRGFVEQQINQVIANTEHNIAVLSRP